jgi:hypothetical protein
VALSVVDEAIYYIRRNMLATRASSSTARSADTTVQTASTFQQKRFARPQSGTRWGRRRRVRSARRSESQEKEEALGDKLALKDEGRAGGRMQMAQRARG